MNPPPTRSDGDAQLAELFVALDGLSDDARPAIIAAFAAQHPELAADLGGLLETAGKLYGVSPGGSEPTRRLERGQSLGAFTIERLIAIGGMGEIYEAEQTRLGRRVIVKVIRRKLVTDAARDRFLQEQRALARLHHTHIVPVYASGEDGELHYFAMPFIPGRTLAQVVSRAAAIAAGTTRLGTVFELSSGAVIPKIDAARSGRPRLSIAYTRSVADALIQAAEALEHAHQQGILHRDVKPSNLMVDPERQCWVIDFGLAVVGEEKSLPGGTPAYMAPEQHEGNPEPRSDVWGLGATLYELLALRPAFATESTSAIRDLVRTHDPPPPHTFVRGVPAELESICRKAMSKELGERYATPAEFAADLRNWLDRRPTAAHGSWSIRPLLLWLLRNWRWATPLLIACAAGAALIAARFDLNQSQSEAAEQREKDSLRRERELQREVLLQRLQRLRLAERQCGWSAEAWELARQAAAIDPTDVQAQAVATLSGLDAKVAESWTDLHSDCGSLAFDSKGNQLLMGGWDNQPARLWVRGQSAPRACGPPGRGPVAFRLDALPVRLLTPTAERPSLLAWDVAADRPLLPAFPVPVPFFPEPEGYALSANASTAAAILPAGNGREARVVVWDLRSGDRISDFPLDATAVALSPDGTYLAAGNVKGRVQIWPLPAGEPLILETGGTRIRSLAFGRSPRRDGPDRPGRDWLLASGHSGGDVAVFDVASGVLVSHCHGGQQDTLALAFSPDGTMLATAGRYYPRLWNVRTGRLMLVLLQQPSFNQQSGLAFDPDGHSLGVTGINKFGSPGGIIRWALEPGRGIQELRGLAGSHGQIRFSRDGRRIAALSHNWEVGVWDADTGRVLMCGTGPQGLYPNDHAALVFDADAMRVACQAGTQARLWDIESGRLTREYALPPGLGDALAFHRTGLLSIRFETAGKDRYPERPGAPAEAHPRVIRIRELPAIGSPRPLHELHDLPWHVYKIEAAPDGRFALADGRTGPGNDQVRLVVFDPVAGKILWSTPLAPEAFTQFDIDHDGESIWYASPGHNLAGIHVIRRHFDGRVIDPVHRGFQPRGRNGEFIATEDVSAPFGVVIRRAADGKPILHLARDAAFVERQVFDRTGKRFAWGQRDGSVMVADLDEVQRRLTEIGLGW